MEQEKPIISPFFTTETIVGIVEKKRRREVNEDMRRILDTLHARWIVCITFDDLRRVDGVVKEFKDLSVDGNIPSRELLAEILRALGEALARKLGDGKMEV